MGWSDLTAADLLRSAHDIAPLIADERARTEATQRFSPRLLGEMRRRGMFSLSLPKSLGGPELAPADLCRVVEVLAAADGAAGWCAGIASATSRLGGYLPHAVAAHVYADGHSITAGTFAPSGKAVLAEGGFIVTGQWSWGSGIRHGDWIIAACRIFHGEEPRLLDGRPDTRMLLLPASQVEILEAWDVSGLRGTGSHDFRIDRVFVPAAYSVDGTAPAARDPGPLYALPFVTIANTSIASVPLGIARTAIDAVLGLAADRLRVGSATQLRQSATTHVAIARAEAMWRAARGLLYDALETIFAAAASGDVTLEHRATCRLACAHAAATSGEVVGMMFALAGSGAIRESGPLARCWRDVHATMQHAGISATNFENAGRVLLGLPPTTPRF